MLFQPDHGAFGWLAGLAQLNPHIKHALGDQFGVATVVVLSMGPSKFVCGVSMATINLGVLEIFLGGGIRCK